MKKKTSKTIQSTLRQEKEKLSDLKFKADKFRQANDIRNKSYKELATYQRVHARSVARIETEYLDRMLPEVRIARAFKHMFLD